MPVTAFGSLVKARREELKELHGTRFSQEELAARIGKKQGYISDIETGRSPGPNDRWMIRRLAAELDLPEAELARARGLEVTIGDDWIPIRVVGSLPTGSVPSAKGEGVDVRTVRVGPEKIRHARNPEQVYGLEVGDESMRGAGIIAGDVILVEPPQGTPVNGQLVVVRLGTEISLKRWSLFRSVVELRDGQDDIVWRGAMADVEVVALYVHMEPLGPR